MVAEIDHRVLDHVASFVRHDAQPAVVAEERQTMMPAARKVCPPEAEAYFVERARRIAESLELGIAGQHGVLLGRAERSNFPPSAN